MYQTLGIQPVDAELVLTTVLRDGLATLNRTNVHVSNRVPEQRADWMVIVRRDGGAIQRSVDRARFTIRCWSTTEANAVQLGSEVIAVLGAAPDGDPIVFTDVSSGPNRVPDESEQPSTLVTVTVGIRAVDVPTGGSS